MHILVVYNPKSGTSHWLDDVKKAFADAQENPEYISIADPALKRKARAFANKHRSILVALGGDGTVNAVAALAVATHARLGVIPAGTLNHFAKDAHIPLNAHDAVATILQGKTIQVDTATIKGRTFINNSSVGFYPQSLRVRKKMRHIIGNIPAAIVGLASVAFHPRRYRLELTVEGKKLIRRTPFVFVGNNPYTISTKGLFERSELTRGTLAIYVVKTDKPWHIIRMFFHAVFTRKRKTPDFDIVYAERCTIRSRHSSMHVALDGEVSTFETPLAYQSQPKSLRLIVPR